jgi:hypothetical protein
MRGVWLIALAALVCVGACAAKPPLAARAVASPSTRPVKLVDEPRDVPLTIMPVAPSRTLPSHLIDRYLADLGSDDWHLREHAQAELSTGGEVVHQRVAEASTRTTDPHIQGQCEAILAAIDSEDAFRPTLVTVHARRSPASDVLLSIAKQGRTQIRPCAADRNNLIHWTTPIDFDAENMPFWAGVWRACAASGITNIYVGTDRQIALGHGGELWMTPYSSYGVAVAAAVDGPFLVVAEGAPRQGSRAEHERRDPYFMLKVYPEPKLRVISRAHLATVDEAIDNAGASMQAAPELEPKLSDPVQDIWNSCSVAWFHVEQYQGRRMAKFRGSVALRVQPHGESAEFADLLGAIGQTKSIRNRSVTVQSVDGVDNSYDVHFVLAGGGWERQWLSPRGITAGLGYDVALLDSSGHYWDCWPTQGGFESGNGTEVDIVFGPQRDADGGDAIKRTPKGPFTLVWEFPAVPKSVNVAFEFSDLPMPHN